MVSLLSPYETDDKPASGGGLLGPSVTSLVEDMNRMALGPMYAPRAESETAKIGAGAGSPFDAPKPAGGRSLPADNTRKPLGNYTDTLYRQASPNEALEYVPRGMVTKDKAADEPYFADHPSIALGQGRNKNGVLMAFDPSAIHGQINTDMPAFAPAWRNGYGEYRGIFNDQATYQNALLAMRIPTDLKMSRLEKIQLQNAARDLQSSGWNRHDGPGYTEYRRPPPSEGE